MVGAACFELATRCAQGGFQLAAKILCFPLF